MRTLRDVAIGLGVSSREVLARLSQMAAPAAANASSVEPAVAEELRARLDPARAAARGEPPPPPPAGDPVMSARRTGAGPTVETAEPPARTPPPPDKRTGDLPPASRGSSLLRQLAELPLLILLAFVIAVVIKTFLVQAFFIPSTSMLPTLQRGDRVLVEKLSYRVRDPRAQDIVVFARSVFGAPPDLPWYLDARNFLRELLGLPTGAEQDYIKRIVAVEGDRIRYAGNPRQLTVNGEPVDEPYVKGGRDRFSPTLTAGDCRRLDMEVGAGGCVVPEGRVFVMGDNRQNSEDSRAIGPIERDKIVGHAFVVIWPPADLSSL